MKTQNRSISTVLVSLSLVLLVSACGGQRASTGKVANPLPSFTPVETETVDAGTTSADDADTTDSDDDADDASTASGGDAAGTPPPPITPPPADEGSTTPPADAPSVAEGVSEACQAALKEARAEFLKKTQILRLQGRLEALLIQISDEDMIALKSNPERALEIYTAAAVAAKINIDGSVDKVGKLSLTWKIASAPANGAIKATFQFDEPGRVYERTKEVFIVYMPGEPTYRVGYRADGPDVVDLDSVLGPRQQVCAGSTFPENAVSTLSPTISLPALN